jgi:hypothetical protein
MPDSLNEFGEYKGGRHRVAAARFAVPGVLVGLHLSRVVAAFRHAYGWAYAVSGTCFQEILETLVAFELAELHQLCGSRGKDNAGHILLLATGVRIIRASDREAEMLGHSYCSFRTPPVLA